MREIIIHCDFCKFANSKDGKVYVGDDYVLPTFSELDGKDICNERCLPKETERRELAKQGLRKCKECSGSGTRHRYKYGISPGYYDKVEQGDYEELVCYDCKGKGKLPL